MSSRDTHTGVSSNSNESDSDYGWVPYAATALGVAAAGYALAAYWTGSAATEGSNGDGPAGSSRASTSSKANRADGDKGGGGKGLGKRGSTRKRREDLGYMAAEVSEFYGKPGMPNALFGSKQEDDEAALEALESALEKGDTQEGSRMAKALLAQYGQEQDAFNRAIKPTPGLLRLCRFVTDIECNESVFRAADWNLVCMDYAEKLLRMQLKQGELEQAWSTGELMVGLAEKRVELWEKMSFSTRLEDIAQRIAGLAVFQRDGEHSMPSSRLDKAMCTLWLNVAAVLENKPQAQVEAFTAMAKLDRDYAHHGVLAQPGHLLTSILEHWLKQIRSTTEPPDEDDLEEGEVWVPALSVDDALHLAHYAWRTLEALSGVSPFQMRPDNKGKGKVGDEDEDEVSSSSSSTKRMWYTSNMCVFERRFALQTIKCERMLNNDKAVHALYQKLRQRLLVDTGKLKSDQRSVTELFQKFNEQYPVPLSEEQQKLVLAEMAEDDDEDDSAADSFTPTFGEPPFVETNAIDLADLVWMVAAMQACKSKAKEQEVWLRQILQLGLEETSALFLVEQALASYAEGLVLQSKTKEAVRICNRAYEYLWKAGAGMVFIHRKHLPAFSLDSELLELPEAKMAFFGFPKTLLVKTDMMMRMTGRGMAGKREKLLQTLETAIDTTDNQIPAECGDAQGTHERCMAAMVKTAQLAKMLGDMDKAEHWASQVLPVLETKRELDLQVTALTVLGAVTMRKQSTLQEAKDYYAKLEEVLHKLLGTVKPRDKFRYVTKLATAKINHGAVMSKLDWADARVKHQYEAAFSLVGESLPANHKIITRLAGLGVPGAVEMQQKHKKT